MLLKGKLLRPPCVVVLLQQELHDFEKICRVTKDFKKIITNLTTFLAKSSND